MLRNFISRYSAADGGGSGSGEDDEDDPKERVRSEDVIARSKDTQDAIARLSRELDRNEDRRFKLRDSRRTLVQELADLKTKAAPDGSVILTADQAKLWEGYQALGKPDDLTKALSDRDAAQGELTTFRRSAAFQTAAEAHGYKPTALSKLPSLKDKAIETREIEVEGQKVKRAFVKDGDKETGLAEYIQANDAEFLPALTADGAGAGGTQQRQNGQRYPAQSDNSSQRQSTDRAAEFIARQDEQRKAQPNPLMPKPS